MRPLLAACIWIVLVGGLALYMGTQQAAPTPREFAPQEAGGVFALEVTTSFAAEPDPFALRLDDAQQAAAVLVRLNGKDVLRRTGRLDSGTPLRVEPIAGIVTGRNEFYVEANPPTDQPTQAHAVRVRVLRDGESVAERTLWSENGARIAATFELSVDATPQSPESQHDEH